MYQASFVFGPEEPESYQGGRVCSKCKRTRPSDRYSPTSGGNYLRAECRDCNRKLNTIREHLKRITPPPGEDYTCPICDKDSEQVKGLGGIANGPWVLDHDHDAGTFRGWLCHKCNRSLGGFDDNLQSLKRAIDYLEAERD